MKLKNPITKLTISSLLIIFIVFGTVQFTQGQYEYADTQKSIAHPQNSAKMDIEFINQTLENELFEFYQEDHIVFKGNVCKNVTINIMDAINVEFSDNIFEDSNVTSLTLWNCSNLIIRNNVFLNIYDSPIHIVETIGASVEGNRVTLPSSNPMLFSLNFGLLIDRSPNTIIKNNTITAPLSDGVFITQSPNSYIEKNNVWNSGFGGISLLSSANSVLLNNQILNNSMLFTSIPQPSSGVMVSMSPGTNITGNLIEKSSDAGVIVESSEETIIHKNVITKHEVVGIFLGLSPRSQITNNSYAENGGSTFIQQDQSPDCIIEGNEEIINSGSQSDDPDLGSEKQISGYNGAVIFLIIGGYVLFHHSKKRMNK